MKTVIKEQSSLLVPSRAFLLSLGIWASMIACKDDDSRGCVTCTQPQTQAFEVCEEEDGNASVNGQNTGTSFDAYLDDLVADGADCGT